MIAMLTALTALGLWAQDPPPPPRTPDPVPGRQERRDPFEGPRVPVPPTPPGPERRPMQPPVNTDEVRAWLRENEPETFRRLTQLQEDGRRDEAMRILMEATPRMREMRELKERDPKAYERMAEMRRLDRESLDQAEQARRAPPEEREAAAKKLKETLSRLFDAREDIRQRELAELKRRVESLEKALSDRKAGKDRIVEKRRRELMGEKSEDDW